MNSILFILGSASLIYVWALISIFFHELLHLASGSVLGFSPYRVRVGSGPKIFRFSIRSIRIELCLFPIGGFTYTQRFPKNGIRWKGSLFCLSGPISDIILLFLLIYLWVQFFDLAEVHFTFFITFAFLITIFYQSIQTLADIIPHNVNGKIPNDFKQFLSYASGQFQQNIEYAEQTYKKLILRYDQKFNEDGRLIFNGDRVILNLYSDAAEDYSKGKFKQAVPKYLKILESKILNSGERAILLDELACIPIIQGDKSFLKEAYKWSKEAYNLFPNSKTIQGTYGSFMIESGEYTEGIKLLMSLTSNENEQIDRSISSCYISKAYYNLGNKKESDKWLKLGKEIGGCGGVCDRIKNERN